MVKNRPFQVLIAALIVLGMHVCCCRAMPIAIDSCGTDSQVQEVSADTCCDHGHDHDQPQESVPQAPKEPKHDCCGVHAKPLTFGQARAEVPPLSWTVALPVYLVIADSACCSPSTDRCEHAAVPAPETSLLRRHCALIV